MEFEQYMRQYIVKILDVRGQFLGTGFWVLQEGYCLTCFHIIANQGKVLQSVKLEYNKTIIQGIYEQAISNPSKDIAVLRVTEKDFQAVPTVRLGPARMDTQVRLYGYREGFAEGYSLTGTLHPGQTLQKVGKVYNFQTTFPSQSSLGGMSGAPVFDPRSNVVVGILYGEEKQGPSVSYVHPLDKVYEYWPALANRTRSRSMPISVEQHPKKYAILDRRIAIELITIFTRLDSSTALESRILQLFQAGLGLFEQLIVESAYGSALAPIINREDVLDDAITFLGKSRDSEEKDFIEMIEENDEMRAGDIQFQVMISQYERSKGISTASINENIAYLQQTLLLARQLNAVIISHPDRWPLYHWLFEHSIFNEEGKATEATMVFLPKDIANPVMKIPEVWARVAAFFSRWTQQKDIPIVIYRYGPMTYPFSKALLHHYDQEDLANFEPFLYEFCVTAPALSRVERIST